MSLLSGVILIAPGTLSARENSDADLEPQAGDNVLRDDTDALGELPMASRKQADPDRRKVAANDTVPAGKDAVPAGKDAVPAGKDAVPAGKDAVPAGKDAVPAGKDAVPAGKDAVPAGKDAVPAGKGATPL